MALTSRLELEVDSGGAEQNVVSIRKALEALEAAGLRAGASLDKTSSTFGSLASSLTKAQAANDKASSASDKTAKSADDAAKSLANQRKELDALLGSINPLTKQINQLAAQEAALVKARDSGQINTAAYDAYSKKLSENLDALVGATKAQQVMGESAQQAQARLLAVGTAAVEAAQAQRGLANTATGLSEAQQGLLSGINATSVAQAKESATTDRVSASMKQAAQAANNLSSATNQEVAASQKVAAANGERVAGLDKLLDRLNPSRKALNDLNADLATLTQGYKAGQLSLDQYQSGLGKVNGEIRKLGGGSGSALDGLALGTKQARENLLQLGNALAEGNIRVAAHNILEIGTNAGSSALKFAALAAPIIGVTAAIGALGFAFYDAEKEVSAFNKSLFSGTASSGQTAASLAAISKTVSAVTGDLSEANAAVIALAGAAKLSQTQFINLAQASASIAEFSGKSAADVAKSLGDVGDSATKAAEKISSQYGLLTSAQYQVIAALDEQGKKQEALDALSGFLNENAQKRLAIYKSSLSDIERGWNNISTAISNAYSKVKGELFPDLSKQAEIIERILKTRADGGISGALSTGLSKVNSALGLADGDNDDSTPALEKKLELIKQRIALQQKESTDRGVEGRADEDRIVALAKWDTEHKKNLFDQAKLEQDIKDTRQLGLQAGKSQADIDKEIANIQAKYDKSQPKAKVGAVDLTGFNDAENALKSLTASYDNAFRMLDASEKAGLISADDYALQKGALLEKEKSDVEAAYQAEIAALQAISDKTSTTGAQRIGIDQKVADARQKMVDTLKKLDTDQDILSQQTSARNAKDAASLKAFTQNVQDSLALSQQGLDNQLAGIGLGKEGRQRLQDDLKIRQDYQKQIEKLNRDYAAIQNPTEGQTSNYDKETQILKDALAQRLAAQQDYYTRLAAYQADWKNGANAAFEDYIHETQDIAGQTYTLFSDSLHGVEDAFVNAAVTGKFSFKSLADSIIGDLARIVAKAYVVTPILAALGIGGDSAAGSGGGSGGILSGISGGGSGSITGMISNAKTVISVAGSDFGKAIMSGWNGGDGVVSSLQGALSNGADYVGTTISSAFTAGSTAAVAASESAASVMSTAIADAGAQYSMQFGLEGAGASLSYEAASTAAAASSSLATLSSVLGYIQGVYSIFQSFQSYGIKGAAVTGGAAAAGAYIGSFFGPLGTAAGFAIGAVVGALGADKLFGSGEKYADLSTSATGTYIDGKYNDTGVQKGWQTKAPKYGPEADAQMSSIVQRFSTTLGMLYDTIGNGADVAAYNTLQVRKTSGKYSASFGAVLDDGSGIEFNQQYQAADAAAALTTDYDKVMGTFLAKAIVSSKSLPDYFKAQFTSFASDWNTTADEVIKAIEGVFTRFNGVNDALTRVGVNSLKLNETGMIASDSILNLVASMSDLDVGTATAKEKVDALNTLVNGYYSVFFSANEQFADLTKTLTNSFAGFGLKLPDTREAYRAMVEDIDVTTAAGQALFATVMGLATAADSYYKTIEQGQSTYYSAFESESENTARSMAAVTAEFKKANITLPDTRAGYRKMVEGIDQTTESGKKLYDTLMAMSADADTFYKTQEQSAAAAQATAMTSVSTAMSALQRAVDSQKTALTNAYNDQVSVLNDSASTLSSSISGLTSIGNSLEAALKSLNGTSDVSVKMLRSQAEATLQSALASARAGGDISGFSGLSDALSTVSDNNTDLYSSLQEFNRDQGRTANVVAELNAINGIQLTTEQKALEAVQDQLKVLKLTYDAQIKALDDSLTQAQAQVDALNGVDTSVLSVRDAVNAMNAAVAGAINALAASYASGGLNPAGAGTGYTGSGGGVGYNDINGIFNDVLGRDATTSDAAYWAGLAAGKTAEQLAAAIKADAQANGELPKFAKGGFHSGGIRLVGENGPEIEATGPARYWSASKSAAALNGTASSGNTGEMVERQAWTNRLLNQLIQAVNTQTKLGMPVYPVTQ